jgi:Flp pilus assembly protein TadB
MRRRPRFLYWDSVERPPLRHPYRDTLIVYAALALVIVLVAWATGSDVGKAALVAAAFYVAASAWSLASWRRRLRGQGTAGASSPPEPER